jgi:hypothetical protein
MDKNPENRPFFSNSQKKKLNPFTGDFDLPKRIFLNGLFWFSFDKVRHFLSKFLVNIKTQ